MLILEEADLARTPDPDIVELRIIERLMEKSASISINFQALSDLTKRRDIIREVVISLIPMLKLSRDLGIFNYGSKPLESLDEFIRTVVKVLAKEVYMVEAGALLIANEWLLAQNDLALILQLAHEIPSCGPSIGESFGYATLSTVYPRRFVGTFTLQKGLI